MQVAICDDDEGCCSQLENWLDTYQKIQGIPVKVHVYHCVDLLLEQMEAGCWFDAIFLDIEFPGSSGIELGQKIRKQLKNEVVNIIFISGKTKYCKDLFEMEPLNYHHKPLRREKIFADMDKLVRRSDSRKMAVQYSDDGVQRAILLADIMYIRAMDKKLELIIKGNKKLRIRDSIQRFREEFKDYPLCQCHRSYLVNLNYVDKYLDHCFFMKNGAEIPVGRRYLDEVKKTWASFGLEVK